MSTIYYTNIQFHNSRSMVVKFYSCKNEKKVGSVVKQHCRNDVLVISVLLYLFTGQQPILSTCPPSLVSKMPSTSRSWPLRQWTLSCLVLPNVSLLHLYHFTKITQILIHAYILHEVNIFKLKFWDDFSPFGGGH